MKTVRRTYQQGLRAERALANREGVVQAAVHLLRESTRLDQITLDEIADRAGVAVRTVLRQFGSRDALLEAALAVLHDDVVARRAAAPDDPQAALRTLLEHYEADGDFTIRALAQEHDHPLVQRALDGARAHHRGWLAEVFAAPLARVDDREQRLTELYAATDVYVWKLLRRDFGLGFDEALETVTHLVMGVLAR